MKPINTDITINDTFISFDEINNKIYRNDYFDDEDKGHKKEITGIQRDLIILQIGLTNTFDEDKLVNVFNINSQLINISKIMDLKYTGIPEMASYEELENHYGKKYDFILKAGFKLLYHRSDMYDTMPRKEMVNIIKIMYDLL